MSEYIKHQQGNYEREIFLRWFFLLSPLLAVAQLNAQIPSVGADLPSLSNVHWGMKMQDVSARINKPMASDSDSSCYFEDSFLESKALVLLTFGQHPEVEGLKSVEVQLDDNNSEEKLLSYLKMRYGEKYESKNQEKTKLFFTIQFERKKWALENESVSMITFSKGSDILALNIFYSRTIAVRN